MDPFVNSRSDSGTLILFLKTPYLKQEHQVCSFRRARGSSYLTLIAFRVVKCCAVKKVEKKA